MIDPSVIAAIRAAVEAEPTNIELRSHLASLLADAGSYQEALDEAVRVLAASPDHLGALEVAAASALSCGQDQRAEGYRRMLDLLKGAIAADADSAPIAPRPIPVVSTPETAEELFESWADSDAPTEPEIGAPARSSLRLSDVAGLEDVKKRLDLSFLAPLRNPELSASFGKSMRGGLLLWGPPGCGKTFLAKALAGELDAAFYAVGLNDVLDMWVGQSERNLSGVFAMARANRPCVLFFDEVDALGMKRTELRGTAMRGVVNQLLHELDGVGNDNEGVFVLGATNHPWDVDTALRRPGRFDRTLLVLPPDRTARQGILAFHLRDRPTGRLDLDAVAKATDGFSGADLALVCEQAAESAMGASIESGRLEPIRQADLAAAAKATTPSVRPWLETAKNYAMFSNDGSYDELLAYLRRRR